MQDQELVHDFLVESHENLARLDQEMVELEQRPNDTALLASVFRTVHTIKGTCGFLDFAILEGITHQAENILSQLRDGQRELTPAITSLILRTIDATREILASIESGGTEGNGSQYLELKGQLAALTGEKATGPDPVRVQPQQQPQHTQQPDKSTTTVADATIRVGVDLLDKLMNLVGELVLTRNQIVQAEQHRDDGTLSAAAQRLDMLTTELQESVMKTRMQPIGTIWSKLPRVVRDIAAGLGKQIRLEMQGTETELDRTIIEAIKDPMVHLVRNSCDHGVETPEQRTLRGKPPQGILSLRAFHEGGQVIIEIGDDGAGIDVVRVKQKAVERGILPPEEAERLSDRESWNLIFEPGFSTAAKVTNVSGRGVGMDVVKSGIEKIGGTVEVVSQAGNGARVKLRIPLTLAIVPGLLVASGGEQFVIPQTSLIELIRVERGSGGPAIEHVHGTPVYRRRGALLPIAYLNEVLGLDPGPEREVHNIIVLQADGRQFGLVADSISDTQEIVVKPLGRVLNGLTIFAGATILGDGKIALILDVAGLGHRSGVLQAREAQGTAEAAVAGREPAGSERDSLLLFSAGTFERLAVPLSLVARLEEFAAERIERSGGAPAVQNRGRILPLITIGALFPGAGPDTVTADPAQVIAFDDGDRSFGLVVDRILDVVEEEVPVRKHSTRPGLLGSLVVGGRVADLIDPGSIRRLAGERSFSTRLPAEEPGSVLVVESSPFSRALLRSSLVMAGYRVVEASSCEEALKLLEQIKVSVVLADLDLAAHELLTGLRRHPGFEKIPVVALAGSRALANDGRNAFPGFDAYEPLDERQSVLDSVARLAEAVGPPAGAAETGEEVRP